MRFESRELKGYAEPVNANRLVEGEFYFMVQFADERLLVPIITTWIFLGRKLDPDDVEETLYIQNVESCEVTSGKLIYDSMPPIGSDSVVTDTLVTPS